MRPRKFRDAYFLLFLTLVKQHAPASCSNFSMRTYKQNSRRGTPIPIRHKRRFGHLTAPLQDELNSLFDEVLSDSELGNKNPGKGWPTMHVSETAKTFNIRIEAPCMIAEDFSITTTYDFIIITVEKRSPDHPRGQDIGCVFFHRTLSFCAGKRNLGPRHRVFQQWHIEYHRTQERLRPRSDAGTCLLGLKGC